jgi:predicted RecB family nuclease
MRESTNARPAAGRNNAGHEQKRELGTCGALYAFRGTDRFVGWALVPTATAPARTPPPGSAPTDMQLHARRPLFAATDVVAFLLCEHLTRLDFDSLGGAAGEARRSELDESAELIARKGNEHEQAYLQDLRAQGLDVVDIAAPGGGIDDKVARTLAAMQAGADVVYQATLRQDDLVGHADFLLKMPGTPSALGAWSYEVADTKLARSAKAKFLVQLAFYSHLLAPAQGLEPQRMHVVLGDGTQRSFSCRDYLHYFRALLARLRGRIGQLAAGGAPDTHPVPCSHCDLCHWRERCEARRIADDHLCQVADIRRVQWQRLQQAGIGTMAQLAALPAGTPVPRMHPDTLAKLAAQAALQDHQRRTGERKLQLLPPDPAGRRGFFRLPEPDAGDLFFDMEGDPLEDGGLEYLFGLGWQDGGQWMFRGFWAHDRAQERVAFEQFIDFVGEWRLRHPGAHVYHYASYEETALKRLACLHGTREAALDDLLRAGVLVDLYKVVREALRISEPSYSIKYVEHFYRAARAGDVQNAGASIVWYERWRETGQAQLLQDIEAYNRDDVESTRDLHRWLLQHRPAGMPWRVRAAAAPAGASAQGELTRAQLLDLQLQQWRARLVDGLPADRRQWTPDHHVAELTWQLLDFHRRADKPGWWELFARMDKDEDELVEDPECLGGLVLDPRNPPRREARSTVYTYLAPEQETKLATGQEATRCDTGESIGTITYDEASRRVQIKLGASKEPLPARLSIGPGGPINTKALVQALHRFAEDLAGGGGRYLALHRLLRREPPRLAGWAPGQPIVPAGADLVQASIEAALAMDQTCLYVQGAPGAGKTHTGSRMIVALLQAGRRVGILSNSNKAIHNLLAGVLKAAQQQGVPVQAVKKASGHNPESEFDDDTGQVENVHANDDVWGSDAQLVTGTAWLFADAAADQRLDALFVDEAGQVALANLVAAGTSARNLVLLGDQMQLAQPVQGVHPGRSGDSALDYLLDGAATIAPDRGIFLGTTWRMHPQVCTFISDAVYEGRLQPEPGTARRTLVLRPDADPLLRPAGLVHAPIEHHGCSQSSEPEAALVARLYGSALQQQHSDREGVLHPMTADNILVVAPYNVQVNLLKRTLPAGARVGTVDKFQGQEAEVVIVSMTTSSEQDLPRNIDFLYSKNRLNVAISRAKCLAIVVANPRLTAIGCQTPEQMALVNLLCWVAEVGR